MDEGDNAPLPLTKARLLLPSYRLRFYHAGDASLRLVYGRDDLQPPQYDLALLAPRVMGARAREVDAAPAAASAAPSLESLASPRRSGSCLTGAVLVLLALIVRLVRGTRGRRTGGLDGREVRDQDSFGSSARLLNAGSIPGPS